MGQVGLGNDTVVTSSVVAHGLEGIRPWFDRVFRVAGWEDSTRLDDTPVGTPVPLGSRCDPSCIHLHGCSENKPSDSVHHRHFVYEWNCYYDRNHRPSPASVTVCQSCPECR